MGDMEGLFEEFGVLLGEGVDLGLEGGVELGESVDFGLNNGDLLFECGDLMYVVVGDLLV